MGLIGIALGLTMSACSGSHPPLAIHTTTDAPDTETRDFDISVDGKHAGRYRMEITRLDERRLVMSGQAAVRIAALFYTYTYTYRGTETYADGRLVGLKSTSNDNGKKFQVSARPEGDGLLLTVNGKEHRRSAEVWTTSYWHLPANATGKGVALLEPDTGKKINGHLGYVGKVILAVLGHDTECRHFRLTGTPSPVDLWYDSERRLVRQDYLDDGHRTVLVLKKKTEGEAAPASQK